MPSESPHFVNTFQQLGSAFYSDIEPSPLKSPFWIHIHYKLSDELGFKKNYWNEHSTLKAFSGYGKLTNQPLLAMVYSGHQFGGYSPQLGDGRAALLAQITTRKGMVDLHLKGIGRTPYSRFGDGRAVLRSSIREYLAGEAMHHLGIPSTRALCLLGSEEPVMREALEKGAMIARVAKTHIRFGHFEYFHYTQQGQMLKKLADYVIQQFLPEHSRREDRYIELFRFSVARTATLIAQWQAIGFAHGVMNTDNMSIIGETLDYGPYTFLDSYDPSLIGNHSDTTGRYAFDQQPSIGLWNLNALAHAFSSLIEDSILRECLEEYEPILIDHFSQLLQQKLGFQKSMDEDKLLTAQILSLMAEDHVDYTYFFRQLCDFNLNKNNLNLHTLFKQQEKFSQWCQHYKVRLTAENSLDHDRQHFMRMINPKFIPRNYLLQVAITKAQSEQDFTEIDTLFTLFQTPYDEHPGYGRYAEPPPEWGKHLELSCSS